MPLHLVKLCVGADSIGDLEDWVKERVKQAAAKGKPRHHMHVTRMKPKRDTEILDGGSLYWVIKGEIACREKIVALDRALVPRNLAQLVSSAKNVVINLLPWLIIIGLVLQMPS